MAATTPKVVKLPAIRSCSCNHEFQDKHYGKGMRLKNATAKGYRCTVCAENDLAATK